MRGFVVITEPGVIHGWGAASVLAEAAGIEAISMGDLCRDDVRRGTAWGQEVSRHLEAGELVPDEVLVGLVADTLDDVDTGWVLFGFPRTVRQAESLAEQGHEPGDVVNLVLDEERIDSDPRLAERRDVLMVSLGEHRARVEPLWVYYRAHATVHTIGGSGDFYEVAAAVTVGLGRAAEPTT